MPDLSRCNICGAVLRVVHYPGWGDEPVKHECRPVDLCRQGTRLMAQADAAEGVAETDRKGG